MSIDDQTLDHYAKNCPSDDRLAELLTESGEEASRLSLKEHVGRCGRCQQRIQTLAVVGPDWQTWQDRLGKANFKQLDQDPDADRCPTCGAQISPKADPLGRTQIAPQVAPADVPETQISDSSIRFARLETELPDIPGYEMESVLGRGGMGVVYRARQVALNRPVALKMIVAGRHATLQQLARFQIEAEALACLTHENIVQIYEFGEHDDGPYLALEFVEGKTLHEVLKQRQFTPIESARLCLTIARAIHLAHSGGVVHRDLKPANILMTASGQPKITDFGLAKRLSENSEWTKTDAIMGTPHYMAPEQAGGESHAVGPLADVYSLGSIMFELLAGRPPFTEGNVAELLGKICSEPAPSLRKQDPQIPKDLATICLRCLEKDRFRRYETADDLADDLTRFLENRPIKARPIGVGERLVKWARRRPAVALMLMGLVGLLIVIGVGGAAYNLQLRRERDRAETHFQLATAAVDEILAELDEETFLVEPRYEERRKELLNTALDFTKTLASEAPDNPVMQRKLAFCQRRLGDIHRLLGQHDEAKLAYQQAIDRLGALRQANPSDKEAALQLAAAHGFLGEFQRTASQIPEARRSFATALELYGRLLQDNEVRPEDQAEFARVLYNFSILQKDTGELNQARQSLNAAITKLDGLTGAYPLERQYKLHLARGYINLGSVMRMQKSLRKGRTAYQQAIVHLRDLCKRYPTIAEYQYHLALAQNNLGNLLSTDRQYAEAVKQHELAEITFQRLVADHPNIPQHHQQLANTRNSLGAAYYRQNYLEQTTKAWNTGRAEFQWLVDAHPDVPDYRGGLGMIQGNLGYVYLQEAKDIALAQKHLESALKELRTALKANPSHSTYRPAATSVCRNLARLYRENRLWEQAATQTQDLLSTGTNHPADIRLAVELAAGALKTSPESSPPTEQFRQAARAATEAFRQTPAGEDEIRNSESYQPLQQFLESR